MTSNESKKEEIPSVIIYGSEGKDALDIVKGVLGDTLPKPDTSFGYEKYKWLIDNKYYTSEVELCNIKNISDLSSWSSAEALIFYINLSKAFALEDADSILAFMKEADKIPEVLLLVCDCLGNCTAEGNIEQQRVRAQDWCVEHGWELVELSPEISINDCEEDLEDDFVDSWGFQRIKQALNAHTWSNLQLKAEKNNSIDQLFMCLNVNDHAQHAEMPYAMLKDDGNDFEEDLDEFSALFSSLGEMKQKAETLPVQERRIYAEKMAVAFWKSLGGDEEELQGLEDSDDGVENV